MKRAEAASRTWLQLLDQERRWKTRELVVIKIKDMTLEHRLNTMASLLQNASRYAESNHMQAMRASLSVGHDPSDGVFSAMCGWEAEAEFALAHPRVWMRGKPLFRALAASVRDELAA